MPAPDLPPYRGVDTLEIMAEARNYNRFLLDLVLTQLRPGVKRIMDFGAGTGTFALPLRAEGRSPLCLEPDPVLRQRLAAAGLATVPGLEAVSRESLDFIYTFNVLEHIADDAASVAGLAKRLRPGGRLLVYVPAFQVLFSSLDRNVGHYRRYTRRGLVDLLEGGGLQVRRAVYADSLGFGAALLYRLTDPGDGRINRRALGVYDRLVFPVSRVLDRVCGHGFGKNVLALAERPT